MKSRKIIYLLLVLGALIAGYFIFSFLIIGQSFSQDKIPNDLVFNKEIWENGTSRERGQMVNYLIDSIGVIGKSKEELIRLTGMPDDELHFNNIEYQPRIYYHIDLGHAFHYDMIVFFDSTDTVTDILFDD